MNTRLYEYLIKAEVESYCSIWHILTELKDPFIIRVYKAYYYCYTYMPLDQKDVGKHLLEWASTVKAEELEIEFNPHEIIEMLMPIGED